MKRAKNSQGNIEEEKRFWIFPLGMFRFPGMESSGLVSGWKRILAFWESPKKE